MNLKDIRFSNYIIDEGSLADVGDNYHPNGDSIYCKDLLDLINELQHERDYSYEDVVNYLTNGLK